MIAIVENLLKMNLPIFIILDCQEWEAILDYDIKKSDIVEYEILDNIENEEYILITEIKK